MIRWFKQLRANANIIRESNPLRLEFWSGLQALVVSVGILVNNPTSPLAAYIILFSTAIAFAAIYQLSSLFKLSLKHRHNSNWISSSIALCLVVVMYFENNYGLMMAFSLNGLMTLDCFLSTYRFIKASKS